MPAFLRAIGIAVLVLMIGCDESGSEDLRAELCGRLVEFCSACLGTELECPRDVEQRCADGSGMCSDEDLEALGPALTCLEGAMCQLSGAIPCGAGLSSVSEECRAVVL